MSLNKLKNKNRESPINLKEKIEYRDSKKKNLNQSNNSNRTEIKSYKRNSLSLSKNDSILLSEKIKSNLKMNNH